MKIYFCDADMLYKKWYIAFPQPCIHWLFGRLETVQLGTCFLFTHPTQSSIRIHLKSCLRPPDGSLELRVTAELGAASQWVCQNQHRSHHRVLLSVLNLKILISAALKTWMFCNISLNLHQFLRCSLNVKWIFVSLKSHRFDCCFDYLWSLCLFATNRP